MNYTETQLEAIRLFGKKDLSDWCYTLEKNWTMWHCWNWEWKKCYNSKWEWGLSSDYWENMWEILWHEPHLEDVFRVAEDKKKRITIEYYTQWPHLIINPIEVNLKNPERIEYNPTLPLLEQSEETLTQLINLFK